MTSDFAVYYKVILLQKGEKIIKFGKKAFEKSLLTRKD